jgi:hypothetical protein
VSGWVGGWVGGWVSEWVGEWVGEWVSEWVGWNVWQLHGKLFELRQFPSTSEMRCRRPTLPIIAVSTPTIHRTALLLLPWSTAHNGLHHFSAVLSVARRLLSTAVAMECMHMIFVLLFLFQQTKKKHVTSEYNAHHRCNPSLNNVHRATAVTCAIAPLSCSHDWEASQQSANGSR